MHRKSSILVAAITTASLSGCQLVEALITAGTTESPTAGVCGQYQVVATDEQAVSPEILEQTRSIIEDRVNATGVADALVVSTGEDQILVELPGLDDAAEIRSLIGATGVLEFVPVPSTCAAEVVPDATQPECLAEVEPLFDGSDIDAASVSQDETTGEIIVNLQLGETGARRFDEYADQVFEYPDPNDRLFAIVLDGVVASTATTNAPRFDGQAQISGNFTPEEASNLWTVLRYGSLPLEVREVGFGACAIGGDSSASSPSDEAKRIEMPDAGYAVSLPADWVALTSPDEMDALIEAPVGESGTDAGSRLQWRFGYLNIVMDDWPPLYVLPTDEERTLGCGIEHVHGPQRPVSEWIDEIESRTSAEPIPFVPLGEPAWVDLRTGRQVVLRHVSDSSGQSLHRTTYLIGGDDTEIIVTCQSLGPVPGEYWHAVVDGFAPLPNGERRIEIPASGFALTASGGWWVRTRGLGLLPSSRPSSSRKTCGGPMR